MTEGRERVRLRAREGEAVEWTRRVAQRAGTLKDMMDDAPTEDGVYPVPMIAAAELAVLREMCEADSMPARLEQCSISELFRLVEGASFLDAPGALNHAQRALATRLNGKRADELRELLGATDDFGSAENRVAALAEPAFSPGVQLSVATAGSAAGPPALQPQPSLSGDGSHRRCQGGGAGHGRRGHAGRAQGREPIVVGARAASALLPPQPLRGSARADSAG
jgi:hypothetical protein